MFKAKSRLLGVLGVLVVFAISAVATSSASATFSLETTACGTGTIVNLCWESAEKGASLKQLKGEEEFLILLASGDVHLTATLGTLVVEILCKDTIGLTGGATEDEFLLILQPSPLVANSTIDATLLFIECTLEGALGVKCLVPVEKETFELSGTVEEGSENNILFKPVVAGGPFIEIPFTNNTPETCPATIKGTKKVTGEQLCTWSTTEKPVLEDLEEHLLVCGASELLFAEQPATFTADYEIALENEPFWAIEES
jgi:hypothetical protein